MSSKSWKRKTAIGVAEPLPVYRACLPQLPLPVVAVGEATLPASVRLVAGRRKSPILPNWKLYLWNILRSSAAAGEVGLLSDAIRPADANFHEKKIKVKNSYLLTCYNNNGLLYIAAQCWIVHKTLKH